MGIPGFVANFSLRDAIAHYRFTGLQYIETMDAVRLQGCTPGQIAGGYENIDGDCILTGWNWNRGGYPGGRVSWGGRCTPHMGPCQFDVRSRSWVRRFRAPNCDETKIPCRNPP